MITNTNFEENKNKIVEELNKKIPNLRCPACGIGPLTLGGGFFAHDLQENLGQRQIGGVNIPTVPVICSRCGFIMEFAAGTLGLLPTKPSDVASSASAVPKEEKNEN